VFGCALPVSRSELPDATNQTRPIADVTHYGFLKVEFQKGVIGILASGIVWFYDGCRTQQHLFEATEEERVNDGEMTCVFVGRPAPRLRPPPEEGWGYLANERHDDLGRPLERFDDSLHRVYSYLMEPGGLTGSASAASEEPKMRESAARAGEAALEHGATNSAGGKRSEDHGRCMPGGVV